MLISKKEADDLIVELSANPALDRVSSTKIRQLIGMVIDETTRTNKGIEDRFTEVGAVPPEITIILMHYGALTAIVRDLPDDNWRRQLVEAGEVIGKFIAKKFGEKIAQQLREKAPPH